MSKFMMFCRDFKLVKNTEYVRDKQSVTEDIGLKSNELIEIFKKNSHNYKEMDYEQFQTALSRIAATMFPDSEALTKLYEYLDIKD